MRTCSLIVVFVAASCAPADTAPPVAEPREPTPVAEVSPEAEVASQPTVAFLGDSLTAGFGLAQEDAFPTLVREKLAAEGLAFRLVDAGISGDTTSGGLDRLSWLLRQRPDVVVIELGANDGLRGQSLEVMESNLRALVSRSRDAGAKVLLCGMLMPPNYGSEYADGFREVFPSVARGLDVPLVPFLLEGVAGEVSLNLDDGLHPNAEGHRRVAETLAPHLRAVLEALDE